jgi:hypothetical protein
MKGLTDNKEKVRRNVLKIKRKGDERGYSGTLGHKMSCKVSIAAL